MQPPVNEITAAAPAKPFKVYRIFLPVLLGLAVIVWLFLDEFDTAFFSTFQFTLASVAYIVAAFLLIFLRDAMLIWRFRLLADKIISWKQAFVVDIMSEFTSTVTPTAVGGSSLVVFFLAKEGVETGRSAAIMLVNLFLDELFFVVACPLLFFFISSQDLFPPTTGITALEYVFIGLYALHFLWVVLLYIGIFVRPDWVKKILLLLFKLPFLRRWQQPVAGVTDNMVAASRAIKNRPAVFWIKTGALTVITWVARFLVVNAVFLAFVPVTNHVIIFARQVVLWIFMAAMPTPGGSGVSEFVFKEYYSDVCSSASIVLLVTLTWRLVTYYLYLFLGAFIVPRWLQEAFAKRKKRNSFL
ncbi:MAG: flippase-like domain-containing protein [Prevotellaceae bacterium]|jgi:uncharacterized protein (TIRG00374 family)|nr:flippase-like domain-containing protein [Prevotellaceae bacterium]